MRHVSGWWWVIGVCGLVPTGASAESRWDETHPHRDEERVVIVPNERVSAERLEALERELLDEMNRLRANPRKYAEKLVALRPSYRKNLIMREGRPHILTQEGVPALDEAIEALSKAPPRLPRLAWSDGLARAARDHARDLDAHDALGHEGSDGSHVEHRIARHGKWQTMVAENISFGPTDAEDIVIGLLVDDGVPDRGHREVLLTRELFFAGVGCGPHPSYGTVCVIDYATAFRTNAAIEPVESERDLADASKPATARDDGPVRPEDVVASESPEGRPDPEATNGDIVDGNAEGLALEALTDEPLVSEPVERDLLGGRDMTEAPLERAPRGAPGGEGAENRDKEPSRDESSEHARADTPGDDEAFDRTGATDEAAPQTVVPQRRDAPVIRGPFVIRYYHGPPRIGPRVPGRATEPPPRRYSEPRTW
jgi:uncharacterized protein YkwD